MSKTENPIKFIYATKFNSETLTFTTKRLNVVKECSRYVSLEDGSRISIDNIYDLFVEGHYRYCNRDISYPLFKEEIVYTLKPISKEVKDEIKKATIETLKESIESNKKWLADRELTVIEIKDKIAKQEAKLAKLLKL